MIMKTIVVYQSTSGFTAKYAAWIAEALGADLLPRSQASLDTLGKYDVIIYGGSLHAVGISGVDIIKDNLARLKNKKIIVFCTGASPAREGIVPEVLGRNFSPAEQQQLHFFYLRGGFDFNKLDLINRILMTLLKWKILLKKDRTPDEKGMLAAYARPMDFTRKENIGELPEHVRALIKHTGPNKKLL
jgi:menaquinone-dependent protoporphyrinogen IX oxidase